MYQKIVYQKRFYMAFIVGFLFLFQYVYSNRFSNLRMLQFIIVDISVVAFIFAFHGFELNTLKSKHVVFISTAIGSFLGVLLGMFLVILIFGAQRDIYRHEFIATNIAAIVGIPVFSWLYYRIIMKVIPPILYVVIGDPSKYKSLMDEIRISSHGKIIVDTWIASVEEAADIADKIGDKSILVADLGLYRRLSGVLHDVEKHGVQKHFITDVVEYWLYRIPLQLVEEYRDHYEILLNKAPISQIKRVMDIVLGLAMMLIALPFIIVFGILIVLNSGFPIIFKQPRVGLYEQLFIFYKLRSLKVDEKAENSENPNRTIKQRITLVGKILRKTRVDEFPQFINILNGTMSVVGPRPEMKVYHDKWIEEIPFYGYRNMVRPGVTGWAQINYGHTTSKEEYIRKTEYDLYYVIHKSILFDIQIIMQTFETFLGMKGGR
ncbi:MAG: sugar transferase [bacterium]|jgi:lipopolysaccharide/colanic/teichoic acid biosynthesis glycosyltransferase